VSLQKISSTSSPLLLDLLALILFLYGFTPKMAAKRLALVLHFRTVPISILPVISAGGNMLCHVMYPSKRSLSMNVFMFICVPVWGACGAHGGGEGCIQHFGWEA
jgi:hypothetical protein